MKFSRHMMAPAIITMAIAGTASAQSSIQMMDETMEQPSVNFLAPAPKPAPVEVKPVVVAPKPVELLADKSVALQLRDMGLAAGWELVWEAADFTIGQKVSVNPDFVKALTATIESANAAGTRLRATFYRGNNTVRVTEY